MTLAQRYVWSGTPLRAGQGPAAAHCAELRSFRRGWMALPALNDTVQGWVYDITFFPRVWLCRRFYGSIDAELKSRRLWLCIYF